MKAIILAAGQGQRLKPITDTLPKPLIKINNEPLIVHHILNLKSNGVTDIVINTAHLANKISTYLGNGHSLGVNIIYSRETGHGLETGGGIVNALPLLGSQPFIAVNADIYCNFPFDKLYLNNPDLAHLVLVKNPQHNLNGDYSVLNGKLSNNKLASYTFSGIALYDPILFNKCIIDRYSVTPIVRDAVTLGLGSAQIFDGIWHDIGTVDRLKTARNSIAK